MVGFLIGSLITLSGWVVLLLAFIVNPYLLARHISPRAGMGDTVPLAGVAAVIINAIIPVTFHYLSVPVNAPSLCLAHCAVFILLAAVALARHLKIACEIARTDRIPCMLCLCFAILVVPVTYLAGIDTYKWQDLATSVQVERCVPWLVHPLSLLGFTPRSYPSAQPLLLATIQILGGLGVDWGYFLMSVFAGTLGVFSSYALGRRFFGEPKAAGWLSFFYAFSPVFMRYNHWATGRGLFLALLPLFVLSLLNIPRVRAILTAGVIAALLALSHKTGLTAVAAISGSMTVVLILPRRDSRFLVAVLILVCVVAGCLLAPTIFFSPPLGNVLGFLRYDFARFGWMAPLGALGLIAHAGWFSKTAWRRTVPPLLFTFPIAHTSDMYGALTALPFITLCATAGFMWLRRNWPSKGKLICHAAAALTMLGALTIVVHRSASATPPPVRAAARFLEAYDPEGPLMVKAPGMAAVQIQAYLSGCPRFKVFPPPGMGIKINRPPALRRNPKKVFVDWITYLRTFLVVPGTRTLWYGESPRMYYITINRKGSPPKRCTRLYCEDGVEIYAPAGQAVPAAAKQETCE